MALSKEELAELAALEDEDKAAAAVAADARKRQRLEALRTRKRLAAKHGEHGKGFAVLETTSGNIAIRRPTDTELDAYEENADDVAAIERYAAALVLDPPAAEVVAMMAADRGIMGVIVKGSFGLLTKLREDDAKK